MYSVLGHSIYMYNLEHAHLKADPETRWREIGGSWKHCLFNNDITRGAGCLGVTWWTDCCVLLDCLILPNPTTQYNQLSSLSITAQNNAENGS